MIPNDVGVFLILFLFTGGGAVVGWIMGVKYAEMVFKRDVAICITKKQIEELLAWASEYEKFVKQQLEEFSIWLKNVEVMVKEHQKG